MPPPEPAAGRRRPDPATGSAATCSARRRRRRHGRRRRSSSATSPTGSLRYVFVTGRWEIVRRQPQAVHGRPLPGRRAVADLCRALRHRRLRRSARRVRAADARDHRAGDQHAATAPTARWTGCADLAADPRGCGALVADDDAGAHVVTVLVVGRGHRTRRRRVLDPSLVAAPRRGRDRRASGPDLVPQQGGAVERVGRDDAQPVPRRRRHPLCFPLGVLLALGRRGRPEDGQPDRRHRRRRRPGAAGRRPRSPRASTSPIW